MSTNKFGYKPQLGDHVLFAGSIYSVVELFGNACRLKHDKTDELAIASINAISYQGQAKKTYEGILCQR